MPLKVSPQKLTGRQTSHRNGDVDAFSTSTACCDLDLWPSKCNRVISRG